MNETSKKSLFLAPSHFRIALTLLAITGVVAVLLGIVNGMTKDKIASIAAEKATAARQEVLPEAAEFTALDYTDEVILEASEAFDANGERVGFAIETGANGFGGKVDIMVGIRVRAEGEGYAITVSGVSILDISDETPGVGSKVASSSFLGQFTDMNAAAMMDEASLTAAYDAVSGASYSSEGVRAGVEAACRFAHNLMYQEGGNAQ